MYDVAICDDVKRDRELLKKDICENKNFEHLLRIHEYDSAEALLKDMRKINFFIIFMDIQMESMDGEQAAEEIRKLDDAVVLVFCTGYAEPTLHSIEVQPYRFIKKNMPETEKRRYIDESLEKMADASQIPAIQAIMERKKIILRPNDIIYIEKYRKYLKVHLTPAAKKRHRILAENGDDIRIYDKLANLYGILKPYGFGYPHNSYIINFQYIMSCKSEEIELEGVTDIIFKISRSKAPEFNEMRRLFLVSKYESRKKR